MSSHFHLEINCQQLNYQNERICGDVHLSKRIKEEGRIILVLSDGMGHGVKANVLATLTATMAVNFTAEHKEFEKIADIIMNTLPVCSQRQISYATFTIADIETDGLVKILEYDNPQSLLFRGSKQYIPQWNCIMMNTEKNKGKELLSCSFQPQKEDRIVIFSDGVAQSGMGSENLNFGWGEENISNFIRLQIEENPDISARRLAMRIANKANINDNYHSKDDTSCLVIYFREPRKLIVCSGPPFEKENDKKLSEAIENFDGRKIICGATTVNIVARELNLKVEDSFEFIDPDLPPFSYMEGIDLITEGILTLGKVNEILKKYNNSYTIGLGPADQIVKNLLISDEITFVVGTAVNPAHQEPDLPLDLEIRRTVIRRIAKLLEEKFLKEVNLQFL